MRWFVVFLLIANVVLFFWVQQDALRGLRQVQIPPPDIGRLRLLNEPDEKPPASTLAATETNVAADEPITKAEQPSQSNAPAVHPQPAPVVDPLPAVGDDGQPSAAAQPDVVAQDAVADPLPAVVDGDRSSAPAQPDVVAQDVVEKVDDTVVPEEQPASVAVGPETPLDTPPESSANDATAQIPVPATPAVADVEQLAAATPTETEPTGPEPALQPTCARIGPLRSADANRLLRRLPAHLTLVSDTSEDTAIADGYYVMIPALPDRAAGRAMLKRLSDAGFDDTWLFRRGEFNNAISLGMFSRRTTAQRHADEVADKGFDVELRERTKTREMRWLLLQHSGEGDLRGALPLPADVTPTPHDCGG